MKTVDPFQREFFEFPPLRGHSVAAFRDGNKVVDRECALKVFDEHFPTVSVHRAPFERHDRNQLVVLGSGLCIGKTAHDCGARNT